MIYDPDGVKSEGKEPKVFHAKSEEGNYTQEYVCSWAKIRSGFADGAGEKSMVKSIRGLVKH